MGLKAVSITVGALRYIGDVVNHYDAHFGLSLTLPEKSELVEYLKSL